MGGEGSLLPEGTVTFLFTDIEGSTRLLERLGRDAYGELLERHRALVTGAITAARGSIVDLQGDSVFAAFSSATDALGAAVEAARSLSTEKWPRGEAPLVRFGLHTGEAARSANGYVGIAVHRARRVCDAAHGGQVIASSATRAIVGPEAPTGVSFRDLGEVRLPGFDEPERLFRIAAGGLAEDSSAPRAQPVWRDEQPALLERADELALLDTAIAGAQSGSGRFVVIEGPAGIGKTSILIEGRVRAGDSGLTVLQARGSELESAFSFGVVRQLFEAAVAQRSPAERELLLNGAAAQAARLFEHGGSGSEPADEDAFALLHGLYWLTVNISEAKPLLIAVDDLQWSDAPSLRWLAYLTRRLEGLRVAVLATLRPIDEEQPVLDELLLDPALTTIRPSALSVPSVADLVRAELGSDADEPFVSACHSATGGNPLLLRELLRSLASEDVAPIAAAVGVVERLAPDAVTRSVRLRLARLPEPAARLARAVAVLGDRAERDHAAALAELERRDVAPAAAALARIDLLRPEPPFSFVHPLVRNAVYQSIPDHERASSHADAADKLNELSAPVEQIAAQLLLAPPESVGNATATLREAGERASAEAGLESAVRYYTRALDEPLEDEERGELLLELAGVEARLGSPHVIPHLRDAVSRLIDPTRSAEASAALGRALYWAGQEEDGVKAVEEALAKQSDIDENLRLQLEAELMSNALRLPAQYAETRNRVLALEVQPEQGRGARLLLSGKAYFAGSSGSGSRGEAAALAEAALAAMADDERAWNYTASIYALLHTDQLETGLRFLDESIAEVRRRGAIFQFSSLSMTRAIFHYARGALSDAEADGRAALDALPHKNVWFVPHAHGWLAQILVERGGIDEAAALLENAEFPSTPFFQTPLLRARAMLSAARGDHGSALDYALRLGEALAAFGHTNPPASYPAWRSLAALSHHALGADPEAVDLARQEVEMARDWGAPRTLGRALRILGLIEGGADGLETLHEAVDILKGSPARLELAYALANLGAAMRRGNQRAEAREHLREALELAQRAGAVLLAEEAHEELIAAGARPRRVVQSGAASLTPSERRVAAMAAEGLSNRDIAQALFVTLRTVEMHLSNGFRKLQISSRTQLAAALAADGEPALVTAEA
jgi:class 3 adenylate cyclase/DNA-binding CsgD family transcriptional regulator